MTVRFNKGDGPVTLTEIFLKLGENLSINARANLKSELLTNFD